MGFFYKHLIQPLLAKSMGKKAFTNNPYLGLIIDADEADVIADEQFRVGMAYHQGAYMLPQDNKKALTYFLKAAERGHAVAQLFMAMGCMKYHDDNNDAVMEWLMKAAENGERQAMYNLGISYHRGDLGGKVDVQKSFELFRRAAEKGYGASCARLATIYLNGEDGIEKNYAKAKFWALEAYGRGDEEDGSLFNHIANENDYIDGKVNTNKLYDEAADAGESHALFLIGNAFIEKEIEKAVEFWTKASELGSLYAKCNLARYYRQVKNEHKTANKLFEEVAQLGIEEAQHSLAESFYYGFGVEKNIAKAWEWDEKALNMSYAPARYLLAVMCMQNELTEILPDKVMRGVSYMEQAAMDNYQPAVDFYNQQHSNS